MAEVSINEESTNGHITEKIKQTEESDYQNDHQPFENTIPTIEEPNSDQPMEFNPGIFTTAKPPSGLKNSRMSLISRSRESIHGSTKEPMGIFPCNTNLTKARSLNDLSKTMAQKNSLIGYKINNERTSSEKYIGTSLRKEKAAVKINKKESTSKMSLQREKTGKQSESTTTLEQKGKEMVDREKEIEESSKGSKGVEPKELNNESTSSDTELQTTDDKNIAEQERLIGKSTESDKTVNKKAAIQAEKASEGGAIPSSTNMASGKTTSAGNESSDEMNRDQAIASEKINKGSEGSKGDTLTKDGDNIEMEEEHKQPPEDIAPDEISSWKGEDDKGIVEDEQSQVNEVDNVDNTEEQSTDKEHDGHVVESQPIEHPQQTPATHLEGNKPEVLSDDDRMKEDSKREQEQPVKSDKQCEESVPVTKEIDNGIEETDSSSKETPEEAVDGDDGEQGTDGEGYHEEVTTEKIGEIPKDQSEGLTRHEKSRKENSDSEEDKNNEKVASLKTEQRAVNEIKATIISESSVDLDNKEEKPVEDDGEKKENRTNQEENGSKQEPQFDTISLDLGKTSTGNHELMIGASHCSLTDSKTNFKLTRIKLTGSKKSDIDMKTGQSSQSSIPQTVTAAEN